jgi:hypothetical protein
MLEHLRGCFREDYLSSYEEILNEIQEFKKMILDLNQ